LSDTTEVLQIEGFCEGVMMKGDWQEFHINVGKQYPVKLSTKHDDVKALAAAAGNKPGVWSYNEKDGNPNPNKPGTFYKNRYLNSVEVGAVLSEEAKAKQAAAGGGTSSSAPAGRTPDERRSIERQTIVKAAIVLYPMGLITTDDEWFALVGRIDAFVTAGPPAPAAAAPAAGPGPQEPAAAPSPDDDIPF
jgi:hypothetical protein